MRDVCADAQQEGPYFSKASNFRLLHGLSSLNPYEQELCVIFLYFGETFK